MDMTPGSKHNDEHDEAQKKVFRGYGFRPGGTNEMNVCIIYFYHDSMGHLDGGFKYFLFSPLFGEDEPILTCAYFSNGLVQPPTSHIFLGPHRGLSVNGLGWIPTRLDKIDLDDVGAGLGSGRVLPARDIVEDLKHGGTWKVGPNDRYKWTWGTSFLGPKINGNLELYISPRKKME